MGRVVRARTASARGERDRERRVQRGVGDRRATSGQRGSATARSRHGERLHGGAGAGGRSYPRRTASGSGAGGSRARGGSPRSRQAMSARMRASAYAPSCGDCPGGVGTHHGVTPGTAAFAAPDGAVAEADVGEHGVRVGGRRRCRQAAVQPRPGPHARPGAGAGPRAARRPRRALRSGLLIVNSRAMRRRPADPADEPGGRAAYRATRPPIEMPTTSTSAVRVGVGGGEGGVGGGHDVAAALVEARVPPERDGRHAAVAGPLARNRSRSRGAAQPGSRNPPTIEQRPAERPGVLGVVPQHADGPGERDRERPVDGLVGRAAARQQ